MKVKSRFDWCPDTYPPLSTKLPFIRFYPSLWMIWYNIVDYKDGYKKLRSGARRFNGSSPWSSLTTESCVQEPDILGKAVDWLVSTKSLSQYNCETICQPIGFKSIWTEETFIAVWNIIFLNCSNQSNHVLCRRWVAFRYFLPQSQKYIAWWIMWFFCLMAKLHYQMMPINIFS